MSSRRSSAARRTSGTPPSGDDVEMANSVDEIESDAEGEMDIDGRDDLYNIIDRLATFLCTISEGGEELAAGFQRIPNRRTHPDYFEIISEPVAFSTVRGKIQKKQYATFPEFVRDVCQIWHNAQVYNRPSAPIFGAAVRLQGIFKEELDKLVQSSQITTEDATLPNLGELPPVEESLSHGSEAADSDEEDEDEEEEEDDDDDDDDDEYGSSAKKKGNRGQKRSAAKDRDVELEDDFHRGRGRPPMVLTPVEARIASVIKGLRKFKAKDGSLLVTPFEKLPDRSLLPDYYQTIASPIALDNIKKKSKRKKYHNVDNFLQDMDLMFANAKAYNEDQSELYQAAVELQKETHVLVEAEKAKPDDEFRDEDGKLPVGEIVNNGNVWRVGDWVHIRNPNDLAKPIVSQIFRMWQDREGEKWINACWYYRPEQTVHRFEKHFFEREVVKTGQYRDHQFGEVIDRCFVMFVTRFNKGRPRGLAADTQVYVCESRYNEENFRFNKIKTWASCVPDEVRDRDYEMDLFEAPRPMRKVPSPIKHLLREDARETDELPRPTWGSPNAPPIVGAVHRRPPESSETPPPEGFQAGSSNYHENHVESGHQGVVPPGKDGAVGHGPASSYGLSGSPNHFPAQAMTVAQPPTTPMAGVQPPHQTPVPLPQIPPQASSARPMQYAQPQQPSFMPNYGATYSQSPSTTRYQQMGTPAAGGYNVSHASHASRNVSNQPQQGHHANAYNPPRPPEVYTLPDNINDALPDQIRSQLQHDSAGRVLFFTTPPSDHPHNRLAPGNTALGHSLRYLAGRDDWRVQREAKRKARDGNTVRNASGQAIAADNTRRSRLTAEASDAIDIWFGHVQDDTKKWREETGLDHGI